MNKESIVTTDRTSNRQNFKDLLYRANKLKTAGNYIDAISIYEKVLQLNPESIAGYNNLANLYLNTGETGKALSLFKKALQIRPDRSILHNNIANLYYKRGDLARAIEHYTKAYELNSDDTRVAFNLAGALLTKGEIDKAHRLCSDLWQRGIRTQGAVACLVRIYERKGEYEKAWKLIKKRLSTDLSSPQIAISFGYLSQHIHKEEDALKLILQILNSYPDLEREERVELLFLAGDLSDRLKRYESAFNFYKEGNELRGCHWDEKSLIDYISGIMEVFKYLRKQKRISSNISSELPVFIVGMPRSGTSLLEQIISAHPAVFGAGELTFMDDLIAELPAKTNSRNLYPECLPDASQIILQKIGEEYLQKLRALSPGSLRIIDKMPFNFLHLGLIALIFPKAKIINIIRHPYDTCLSCYFQDFIGDHSYSCSLESLGKFYRHYQSIMQFWLENLELPIYECYYERLIENFEDEVTKALAFLGLEWDDRCREFYKQSRVVRTASYNRVRQPIDAKSVNRWRNYKNFLSPLFRQLPLDNLDERYRFFVTDDHPLSIK